MSDDSFTYQEMRIALAAFALWLAERNEVRVLDAAALVDTFLAETTVIA